MLPVLEKCFFKYLYSVICESAMNQVTMATARSSCWAGCVLPIVLSKFLYITHAAENAEMCTSSLLGWTDDEMCDAGLEINLLKVSFCC